MNATATPAVFHTFNRGRSTAKREDFREKFQRSLRSCVRRGFSVEECFGLIWMETWEEFQLAESEQGDIYSELINWARNARRSGAH